MSRRGAEFGEINPRRANGLAGYTPGGSPNGGSPSIVFNLPNASFGTGIGIDTAFITPISPFNSYRLGQQIFFHLGVLNPLLPGDQFMTRIRLKPWWLRPNIEYRPAGAPNYLTIDRQTFGLGPVVGDPISNNRYIWVPSPKRLDITEYQTAPPVPSPVRHSDSLFLDDLWTMDLPSPSDPAYTALFDGVTQDVSRWAAFFYPAMGYALGLTAEVTMNTGVHPGGGVGLSLTWQSGTLGGSVYQESLG